MKWNKILGFLICVSLFTLSLNYSYATEKEGSKSKKSTVLEKTAAVDPAVSCISINNISMYVKNTGDHPLSIASSWNGAIPKGNDLGAIYKQGILWGGLVSDGGSQLVRVGGSDYNNGNAALTRLFRVRRDVRPQGRDDYNDFKDTDLKDDAANFNTIPTKDVTDGQMAEIRTQYEKDWTEWATSGGPYEDVNKNGQYDPLIDIPGIPGADQTLVINYSDANAASLYRSNPIGLNVQEVFWAYAASNPLGNIIFLKVRIIYTGTPTSSPDSKIDSMFVAQFSDPDNGQYTDDYAGCYSDLDLGYVYNSSTVDALYGAKGYAPPAVGYDFLQGAAYKTGNLNDSAIVNLKWRKGYKYFTEKPMSAFIYYAAGGTWEDASTASYTGTLQEYNYLRGYQPRPNYPASPLFPRPPEFGGDVGGVGTFLLDGDPITKTGWLDGEVDGPGDRRLLCVNGPFSMKLQDTVEVVLSLIAGLGSTNISSVAVLKYNDIFAQYAYDNLFDLPSFPAPSVDIAELDEMLVINWGTDVNKFSAIENGDFKGYKFEGYNVYQLPTPNADLSKAKKIATYDLVNEVTTILDNQFDQNSGMVLQLPAQIGKNSGIQRSLIVTEDAVRSKPLANGQEYYFAVTAYGYNPDPNVPYQALESVASVRTVTPQSPKPGVTLANVGDPVAVTKTGGTSDGSVTVSVINPLKVNGASYKIKFINNDDGELTWSLLRRDTTILANQTDYAGTAVYIDGMYVGVSGPEYLGVSFTSTGTRWLSGNAANGGELMFGSAFLGKNFWGETTVAPADLRSVHVDAFKVASYTDSDGNGKYTVGEKYVVDPAKGQLANMYNTWGPGKWKSTSLVPFKFYAIEPDGSQRQLSVIVRDRDINGQWDPDDGATAPYNYIFVLNTTYDPTGNDWNPTAGGRDFMDEINQNGGPVLWTFWWTPRGTSEPFSSDFTMDFVAPKVLTTDDAFTFTAPQVGYNTELAKADIEKINVFPNPYYGYQDRETSRSGKYITFNHLPQKAIVRIIDLAGNIIRVINKDDASQFITWNLRNQNNYPVASGVYIVYIDMPDLGKTKILKSAIIQEEQILPVF